MTATADAPPTVTAPAETAPAPRRRRRTNAAIGLVAWIVGLIFVAPVIWMLLTSFHSEPDAATNPPSVFAPLTVEGYANFFGADGGATPWPPLLNSLTASIVSTAFVLVLAVPAAYALSIRPVEKWRDVLFFFLSTKMLPVVAALLPVYLIAQGLGVLDNIWLLIVVYTSMNLPIAVWMMRSFLAEVPGEVLEAAALDGCSLTRSLRTIVIPMVLPGIAATALICFIFSWNELLFARVLTGTVAQTAPVFLIGFVTSQGLFLAKVCAAAVVVSLPVLIAGFAAQDKLVQGLSLGAIK
ncbi:carbohydrate ABC transporter membrane protein 2, CUT1 family [Pseudonocardia thermophila]|uniref:Carbohydrate ABC transporter membrane protein 2, CUT1 family n=1 Tax=Pseudonocardia thermophila TaxID=1848 RepID=A0A1M6YMU0_PSETH|nr:carbohydrate ABC transporter permease [Pseudonocardia thermophila]SHL19349.1 carbohydrate ABC transporter membrane protein 2, CUT1 family [Pseudonocardia thermophila]